MAHLQTPGKWSQYISGLPDKKTEVDSWQTLILQVHPTTAKKKTATLYSHLVSKKYQPIIEAKDDSKFVLTSNVFVDNKTGQKKDLPKGTYAQVQFGTVKSEIKDENGPYREGAAFSGGNAPPVSFIPNRKNKGLLNLNRVRKPSGRGRFIGNRGDVSEGILAAAIATRFKEKKSTVSEGDIKKTINALNSAPWQNYGTVVNTKAINEAKFEERDGYKGAVLIARGKRITRINSKVLTFDSLNKNKSIKDQVILFVALSPKNLDVFLDTPDKFYNDYKSEFRSAVMAANSGIVKNLAYAMWDNNKYNLIEVLAVGPVDQAGAKEDVVVHIDKQRIANLNISAKAGDVRQVGQVGGVEWANMEELFKRFGIKFPPSACDDYNKLVQKQDKIIPAIQKVYKDAAIYISDQLQKSANIITITDPKTKKKTKVQSYTKTIADYLVWAAAGSAPSGVGGVVLWQFHNEDLHVYNFYKVAEEIMKTGNRVECSYTTTGWETTKTANMFDGERKPEIIIWENMDGVEPSLEVVPSWKQANKSKILMTIRLKREEKAGTLGYFRHYIEKQDRLKAYKSVFQRISLEEAKDPVYK